jgi:plastocyanin
MIKHARVLLPALGALVLVAVPVAQAKPVRAAAAISVTAGKPSEFHFKLSATTVKHGAVTFTVTDSGNVPHDFKICSKPTTTKADTCTGKGTGLVSMGQTKKLTFTFTKAGTYEYLCTVAGHATAGMKGLLKVT